MDKILIIEDEAAVLENLVEIFEEKGYDVKAAEDGTTGIKIAKKELPDLIICDITMPGLNGYEVLKELQNYEPTATIPFIFLTARSDKESLRNGMELGADDYITKPFNTVQLLRAVETRLKKKYIVANLSEKRLDELRLNLASTLPHEFRTPLNGILASIKFLIDYFDTLHAEEIRQLHENIYTSAHRLQRLIINYLFYVELELSQEKINNKSVNNYTDFTLSPAEILQLTFHRASVSYNRENDLRFEINDNSDIAINQEHFYKICEEIADNAFKFSDKGCVVAIKTELVQEPDSMINFFILEVTDYGIGMTAEQIEWIGAYTQFNRTIYEQQGAGLGLIIVNKLVELHHGSFQIQSVPQQYTSVKISIPVYIKLKDIQF